MRKSIAPNRGKSRKARLRQEKINHAGATIGPADDAGINQLPLPSETPPNDAGRNAVAARILELARAHGMTLRATGDLRELLAALRISDPIPIPAFAVVAEILFAILQANQHHQADWETMP